MHMSTSVKMTEADKRKLDALQADLTRRRGVKVTQETLLRELVRMGQENIDKLAPEWKLSPAARRRLMALPMSFGRPSREETIDEELYGWGRDQP